MTFIDNIDPGNSGGSVPTPDSPFKEIKPRPKVYKCAYCEKECRSEDDLRTHRYERHPQKRPFLHLQGSALRKEEEIIRTTLTDDDVRFDDTDLVVINGAPFTDLHAARASLLCQQTGGIDIEIQHQNYPVKHRLVFDIVDKETLNRINKIFYTEFSNDSPLEQRYQRFNDEVRRASANGLSYAGALGCYIQGVMAKDRITPDSHYEEKLGEALDKLQGVSGPLSDHLKSIIFFIRNNFQYQNGDENIPPLYDTKETFKSGKFPILNSHSESCTKIPIDIVTEKIIKFCTSSEKNREAQMQTLKHRLSATTTPNPDKQKLAWLLYILTRDDNYKRHIKHVDRFRDALRQFEGQTE